MAAIWAFAFPSFSSNNNTQTKSTPAILQKTSVILSQYDNRVSLASLPTYLFLLIHIGRHHPLPFNDSTSWH